MQNEENEKRKNTSIKGSNSYIFSSIEINKFALKYIAYHLSTNFNFQSTNIQ